MTLEAPILKSLLLETHNYLLSFEVFDLKKLLFEKKNSKLKNARVNALPDSLKTTVTKTTTYRSLYWFLSGLKYECRNYVMKTEVNSL